MTLIKISFEQARCLWAVVHTDIPTVREKYTPERQDRVFGLHTGNGMTTWDIHPIGLLLYDMRNSDYMVETDNPAEVAMALLSS